MFNDLNSNQHLEGKRSFVKRVSAFEICPSFGNEEGQLHVTKYVQLHKHSLLMPTYSCGEADKHRRIVSLSMPHIWYFNDFIAE